jgi:outer membrane protein assembly factor BamD (BamD/ComL family)
MSMDRRTWVCALCAPLLLACGCASLGTRAKPTKASITDETANGETQVRQASYENDSEIPDYLADEENKPSMWDSMNPFKWSQSKTYKKLTGQEPKPELARALYTQAEEKYRQGVNAPPEAREKLLLEAAAKYAEAAKRWPDSALEQDGLYMAGESYFFADAYVKANGQYELLIKKYPGTKHMDTIDARRYTIAQYWLELTKNDPEGWYEINYTSRRKPWRDTRGHALRVYDKIRIDDPSGKLADDATMAAANAHFVGKNYMKADEYYGDLRTAFPTSEHQFKAHYLGLKTKLLCYQGSNYGGDALDEAEKLIKQIRKQFPKESNEEREFLSRAYAEVRFKKAQREWDTAQYFVKRGEYGSARLYQNTLVKDYDDTPFADRAKKQLDEQKEYPDVPPKYFTWLVDAFPREKPAKPLFYSDAPPAKK